MDGKSRFPRIAVALFLGFCVCGWMFFLGILVGRGNAPVSFNTRGFQDRLAAAANVSGDMEENLERPELDFYEVLKGPMLLTTADPGDEGVVRENNQARNNQDRDTGKEPQGEILPIRAEPTNAHGEKKSQPLKKSLKGLTFKSKTLAANKGQDAFPDPSADVLANVKKSPGKTSVKNLKPAKSAPSEAKDDNYTIQVAAYRDLADAVDEVDRLKKKGISSHRTMGRVGNDIWHRVRVGSFKDMESAQKKLEFLAGYGIRGMILNKKE